MQIKMTIILKKKFIPCIVQSLRYNIFKQIIQKEDIDRNVWIQDLNCNLRMNIWSFSYQITNLLLSNQYQVIMKVQFCLNADTTLPCDQEYTIFNSTILDKPNCNRNTDFKDTGRIPQFS